MSLTPRPVPPDAPRVVIVDSDRRVQQSLSDLLSLTGKVSVVGRAGDVRAALEEVERVHPDVVLVDPRLPDVEAGIALIAGMRRAWPSLRIVLTGFADTEGHSLPTETASYVSKAGSPEDFVSAIVEACGCDSA
jgi:DNA-binding NarL/FixJ family response regulator